MKHLRPALTMALFFFVFTGFVFPLAVTAIARFGFSSRAEGSLIRDSSGQVVGSELVGQNFTGAGYFHPRPSAANYNASSSAASNLGPTNEKLLKQVEERSIAYRKENGLPTDADVPVDAVTTSASGLDPHISVPNALIQAKRVANSRGLPDSEVTQLVSKFTVEPLFGFFGERCVNVLSLNRALDAAK